MKTVSEMTSIVLGSVLNCTQAAVRESVRVLFVVQDIVFQLQRLVTAMAKYHNECHAVLKDAEVFPIEVDLSRSTFTYDSLNQFNDGSADDDDVLEATEADNDDDDVSSEQLAGDVDLISTD